MPLINKLIISGAAGIRTQVLVNVQYQFIHVRSPVFYLVVIGPTIKADLFSSGVQIKTRV